MKDLRHLFINIALLAPIVIICHAQRKGCHQYPCKNGARCVSQPNTFYGYSCICITPWTGVNCDQNSNSGRLNQGGFNNNGYNNNGYNSNNNQNRYPSNNNNQYSNNNNNQNRYPYNNNNNNNQNRYPNNNNQNRYPNVGGSNVLIGQNSNNNPYNNRPGAGSNVYINNDRPYGSSGIGACLMNPCKNGAYCQPGVTSAHFKCLCRKNYYGTHCEYYRQPKGALLAIILGTILPFLALTVIGSIIVYCCCCRG